MQHRGAFGYDTVAHIKNAEEVFRKICMLHKTIAEKQVKVKLPTKDDVVTLSELKENLCEDYFELYFKTQAKEEPVVLPEAVPNNLKKIVDTMNQWCQDTNEYFYLKGLVIHSFDVSKYLEEWFCHKFNKEKLRKDLDIQHFPTTPFIVVYNPQAKVIFLIRTSVKEELRKEIELCSTDMKMFSLLFGDELKCNNIKVISLLARDTEIDGHLKCEGCKHSIVSVETLESINLFELWWHKHASHFQVKNASEIDEHQVEGFSAKFIGFLAAAQYFYLLPTFTKHSGEQMEHALIMLTREQKRILNSDVKHLILYGPFGSGKSVVARKKLQMLLEELETNKKGELVYFVCYDTRSALLTELESSPFVRVHSNKEGKKLSDIVNQILKETNNNVNLIIDEYDGEDLDKQEAEILNEVFEKKFQKAVVFLVVQPMEKVRALSKKGKIESQEKNMFHLLKMEKVELRLVMRNSVEINNLIWVTQSFLEKQQTIYRPESKKERSQKNKEKYNNLIHRFSKRSVNQSTSEESQARSEDIEREVNFHQSKPLGQFGVDEAYGFAKTPRGYKSDRKKIVNTFAYKGSGITGHKVNSGYPELYEMVVYNEKRHSFEKLLALVSILKKLGIKISDSNNKHVILHFDTTTDEIPKPLENAFKYLLIQNKVTSNYKDFNDSSKDKSILVCNFPTFRGLEHANVAIIIDQDIYNVQHYLVEAMARCTIKLAVVVLQRSEAISQITGEWKDRNKNEQLIDEWKIEIKAVGNMEPNFKIDKNLNVIMINCSSKDHEKMRFKFDQYKEDNFGANFQEKAKELLQKRYLLLQLCILIDDNSTRSPYLSVANYC